MNELIKVNYESERPTMSARELWEFLDKPYEKFTKWFDQFKQYGFVDGQDYQDVCIKVHTSQGAAHDATDYEITLDMAKELAMLQKSEKGQTARRYFIELEKKWNSPDAVMARAVKMANQTIAGLQSRIEVLLPKSEMHDLFLTGGNSQTMNEAAKVLGIGRNRLFDFLRTKKILMANNTPYQDYIDRGYFVVVERPLKMGGQTINKVQTFVTAKGVDWLGKLLNADKMLNKREVG